MTGLAAFRQDVLALTADAPGAKDRVLIEVANQIGVVHDLTRYRASESGPRRVLSALLGTDKERQIRSISLLADNQDAVVGWVTEIAEHAAVTAFCLERVAQQLSHVRATAEAAHKIGRQALGEVRELAGIVARIAAECERRLRGLEERVAHLERTVDARQHLDLTVGRWSSGLTHRELPWLCQIVLMARELAAGPCGHAERTDGIRDARKILVARIVERRRAMGSPALASVHFYLDEMAAGLGTAQRCEIAAWLLESAVPSPLALRCGPLTATVAMTAELAALPEPARPAEPGRTAAALVRMREGGPMNSVSLVDLVTGLIDEQFDAMAERGSSFHG